MNDHERLLLLHKKWIGSISPSELSLLEDELASDESFRKEASWLEKMWEKAAKAEPSFQPDAVGAWEKFRKRLHPPSTASRVFQMPAIWKAAAAVALLVSLVAIVPLFLRSGEDGLQHVHSGNGKNNGYTLPDGSVVWLNAFSRLDHPPVFDADKRMVKLEGEAYFEVEADPSHPFIIETPHGEVRVTGTVFNVRAYKKEKFEEVFVKSGKVSFQSRSGKYSVQLKPGERANLQKASRKVLPLPEPLAAPLYWKEGKLNFRDAPLREVFKVLEEYFHVRFNTEKVQDIDCTITIDFAGYSLAECLGYINKHTGVTHKYNSNQTIITLMGGEVCDKK